jgi:integrase
MAVEVYQRPASPYWYYKAPLLDKNGKVLDYERRSTKRKDKAEARLVAQQKIKEILDRSQHGVRDDPLLLGFMSDCVQATLAKGKSDYKNQKVFLDWLTPRLVKRQTRISQFDRSFMVQARRDFSLEGKSEGYCNNLMTFLISIYNQAKDLNLDVPHNQDFKGLKPRVATKTRYLMAGEEERLLHELDPKRSHAIAGYPKDWQERQERYPDMQRMLQDSYDLVCVLIDTGLRHTELTEGLWSSVDTVNFNYLNFYREKVGNEGHLVCTDRLSQILERRWKTSGNSPYIFHHRNDPMRPRGYAPTAIAKAIERAGLNAPHLVKRYGRFTSMHSFRHTFASRLVQAGMSLYAVAGLLGHADVQMTQRYAHLAPQQDAQRAADILNGVQR